MTDIDHKEQVVVVDDEEIDRYVMRRYLARLGYTEILEAYDGENALALLRGLITGQTALIVFLDINMPRIDGFELVGALTDLRDTVSTCPLSVVMYSTSDRTDDRDRALRSPMVAEYLVKSDLSLTSLELSLEKARAAISDA